MFPYLSSMALMYEHYLVNRMTFRYVTKSPTSTAGSIYLAIDYGTDGSLPAASSQSLMSTGRATNASVYRD